MRHRMYREAPVVPSNGTESANRPDVPVVIPGTNYVAELKGSDGLTVVPLVAWEVIDGELFPLPRSLGDDWLVRPMANDDERRIRTTAARMRPTTPAKDPYL